MSEARRAMGGAQLSRAVLRAVAIGLVIAPGIGVTMAPTVAAEGLLITTDWDREPSTAIDWRPGASRILVQWRPGAIERAYVFQPGRGRWEGWGGGRILVRFGSGGQGFAADPARRLGLAPATGAGFLGGFLRARAGPRRMLAAFGQATGAPAMILGVDEPRAGAVLQLTRGDRARLAAAVRLGNGRRLVIDGGVLPSPSCALELATPTGLGAAELGLRLPPGGDAVAAGLPGAGTSPGVDLVLRRAHGTLLTAFGARAELRAAARALEGEDLARARRVRAFGDAALGLTPEMQVRVRAEWRSDDRPGRGRVRGDWTGPFARAAVDWTTEGGVLMQVRARWVVFRNVTVEAGSATWSGPLTASGATVDLPAVPSHTVAPRFSAGGQQTGALIDWQERRIRVRLGWTVRQRQNGAPDGRFAARVDLIGWRERAGT